MGRLKKGVFLQFSNAEAEVGGYPKGISSTHHCGQMYSAEMDLQTLSDVFLLRLVYSANFNF